MKVKGGLSMVARKESLSDFEQEVYENQNFSTAIVGEAFSDLNAQEVKYSQFSLSFREALRPNFSEAEIVDCFVDQALRTEFGSSFVANVGFPKLKRVVSQAVASAQEVKQGILQYTNFLVKENLGLTGKIPQ